MIIIISDIDVVLFYDDTQGSDFFVVFKIDRIKFEQN